MPPETGDVHSFERTFTTEDVQQFAELSRDTQPQHTEPDTDGRLMVHGLLTATVPTKIGGDLEVLAHTMDLEFTKPVYTGETVTCRWRNEDVEEREDRYDLTVDVLCEKEGGEVAMRGTISGVVWKES